ncbi:MAG: hypothetical protein FWB93_06930 [Oscillospiraceae bacterium]|nr:hypothetical protein [Oscillospiraceae bacterium]
MTGREICALASELIPATPVPSDCEFGCVSFEPEDICDRVPTVLNAAILELSALAEAYTRDRRENSTGLPFALFFIRNLDDPLPLPDRFRAACAYFLAAHLCISAHGATAKHLHDLYTQAVSEIRGEVIAVVGSTRNVYGI